MYPRFPQLHDFDWMDEHRSWSASRIAEILGCSKTHVNVMRKRLGIRVKGRYYHWSDVHLELLRKFYPDYPGTLLAMGLDRTYWSVVRKAHRLGLRKVRHIRSSERFWAEWQKAISERLPLWSQNGHMEEARSLVWRPPEPWALQCDNCPIGGCNGPFIPCARKTVEDMLLEVRCRADSGHPSRGSAARAT